MAQKKTRDVDAMTGSEFAGIRGDFDLSQREFAKKLGVSLRSVIRFEGKAHRRRDIPLAIAKLVRCLVKQAGN